MSLTDRQLEVYGFIEDYINSYGVPPTIVEIGEHFGFNNNAANDHVRWIEKKGGLKRIKAPSGKRMHRNIRLLPLTEGL